MNKKVIYVCTGGHFLRMLKRTVFIFLFLWPRVLMFAQSSADSLLIKLDSAGGIHKVDILNDLSERFAFSDLSKSESFVAEALRLADSISYDPGLASSFKNLGMISYLKGDYSVSLDYLERSLKITREYGDKRLEQELYGLIANVYAETNAFDRSLANYQKEYEIALRLGDADGMALSMLNAGHVYRRLDQNSIALESYSEAYKTFESTNNENGMLKTLLSMAKSYGDMNRMDSAGVFYDRIETMLAGTDKTDYRIQYYMDKATLFSKSNPDSAIRYLEKALPFTEEAGSIIMRRDILQQLSDLYATKGEYQKAFDLNRQSGVINDAISGKNLSRKAPQIRAVSPKELPVEDDSRLPSFHPGRYRLSIILLAGGLVFLSIIVILWLFKKYRFEKRSLASIRKLEAEMATLTEEIQKKENQILGFRENEASLKKQNQSLRQLLAGSESDESPLDQIHEISRKIADGTASDIVGLWLYDRDPEMIRCFDEYNREKNIHKSGDEYKIKEYPLYFESLNNTTIIESERCREDPRTMEFNQSRFVSLGIFSRMDIPLKINGKLKGILSVERTGRTRPWKEEAVNFAMALKEILIQIIGHKLQTISDSEQDNNQRIKNILSNLKAPLVTVDGNLDIVMVNNEGSLIFETDPEKLYSFNLEDLLPMDSESNRFFAEKLRRDSAGDDFLFKNICFDFGKGKIFVENIVVSSHLFHTEKYKTLILLPFDLSDSAPGREHVENTGDQTGDSQVSDFRKTDLLVHTYNLYLKAIYQNSERSTCGFSLPEAEFRLSGVGGDKIDSGGIKEIIKLATCIMDDRYGGDTAYHVDIPPGIVIGLTRGALYAILYILLCNAVESLEGQGDIYIIAGTEGPDYFLKVIDTGEGLQAASKQLIFKPFFSTRESRDHYGLGLPVAREILKRSDCTIRVHGKMDRGAEAVLKFHKN